MPIPGERATDGAGMAVEALAEHGPMLLAVARMVTGDNDEAEDLVQSTFELALKHGGSLRDARALRSWLLRIETREAFRVGRRLRRLTSLDGHVQELASPGLDVVEHVQMRDALRSLPRRTRAAIVLHYLASLSVPETAATMGVSENTVKSQLKLGLSRLREVLRDG